MSQGVLVSFTGGCASGDASGKSKVGEGKQPTVQKTAGMSENMRGLKQWACQKGNRKSTERSTVLKLVIGNSH